MIYRVKRTSRAVRDLHITVTDRVRVSVCVVRCVCALETCHVCVASGLSCRLWHLRGLFVLCVPVV